MAAIDGDVLIHKYELFNDMAVALAELQAGIRDRMTPKDILEMILEAEPVDPVKHGRWMPFDLTWKSNVHSCSVCQSAFEMPYPFKKAFVYCPHCGSKMDEECV